MLNSAAGEKVVPALGEVLAYCGFGEIKDLQKHSSKLKEVRKVLKQKYISSATGIQKKKRS